MPFKIIHQNESLEKVSPARHDLWARSSLAGGRCSASLIQKLSTSESPSKAFKSNALASSRINSADGSEIL